MSGSFLSSPSRISRSVLGFGVADTSGGNCTFELLLKVAFPCPRVLRRPWEAFLRTGFVF